MPKSITVTFPHQLSVEEAKRRITAQVAEVKALYIDKVGTGELTWTGDTGHVRVTALAQTTTAEIDIKPSEIRVAIHLPWLLATLSGKIETLLKANASDVLRLGPQKKG